MVFAELVSCPAAAPNDADDNAEPSVHERPALIRSRHCPPCCPQASTQRVWAGQILSVIAIRGMATCAVYASGSVKQASHSLDSASNNFSAYRSNDGINLDGSYSRAPSCSCQYCTKTR